MRHIIPPDASLHVGDVILYRPVEPFGRAIAGITHGHYSHAAIYVGYVWGVPCVVEAWWPRVRIAPLEREQAFSVYTPAKPLSAEEATDLARYAMSRVGEAYDTGQLLWQLGRYTLGIRPRPERHETICSELVQRAYAKIGRALNPSVPVDSPADLEHSAELRRSCDSVPSPAMARCAV